MIIEDHQNVNLNVIVELDVGIKLIIFRREVSKNGSGARNWGNVKNPKEILEEAKVESEVPQTEEVAGTEVQPEPVEEGPKLLSLEEYQRVEEEKRQGELFAKKEQREVVVPNNLKPLEKKKEEEPVVVLLIFYLIE